MARPRIDALVALRSEGQLLVGRDRIRILEAVARHGSITAAARATGHSYKATWDAVAAVNNLLPEPAFLTRAGGRSGGGAIVTEEGRRLIAGFHRMEERLSRLYSLIAEEGMDDSELLALRAAGLRISARNLFQGVVLDVREGPVDVDVEVEVGRGRLIHALVTHSAREELAIAPGQLLLAVVKSTFVRLSAPDAGDAGDTGMAGPNRFEGTVARRNDGAGKAEITLDIGAGKTINTVLSPAPAPGFAEPGARLTASFDAADVILIAE